MTEKHSPQPYHFERVGKRMPYRVPQHFFADFQTRMLHEVQRSAARPTPSLAANHPQPVWRRALAMAAAVAAVCMVALTPRPQPVATSFADVEQAFAHLDAADQQFMLTLYEHDAFFEE